MPNTPIFYLSPEGRAAVAVRSAELRAATEQARAARVRATPYRWSQVDEARPHGLLAVAEVKSWKRFDAVPDAPSCFGGL